MINIFGVDVTDADDPKEPPIELYCVRTPPEELTEEWERLKQHLQDFRRSAALPASWKMLGHAADLVTVIAGIGILHGIFRGGLDETYRNAPVLFYLAGICIVLSAAVSACGLVRNRRAAKADGGRTDEWADSIMHRTRDALGVPEDAVDLDVLSEAFSVRDGTIAHRSSGGADYRLFSMITFVENGNLCIAHANERYEIPLSALRFMRLENREFRFRDWYKPDAPGSAKYREFGIRRNYGGVYTARAYAAEIIDLRGDFYLLIPEYERDVFAALTHLTPEQA